MILFSSRSFQSDRVPTRPVIAASRDRSRLVAGEGRRTTKVLHASFHGAPTIVGRYSVRNRHSAGAGRDRGIYSSHPLEACAVYGALLRTVRAARTITPCVQLGIVAWVTAGLEWPATSYDPVVEE